MTFGLIIAIGMLVILVLVVLVQTFGLIKELVIMIMKLFKGKKGMLECNRDFSEINKETEELPLSESRKAFLADFTKRLGKSNDELPLLTLSEFFDGNNQEDSIAPNQWDDDIDCERPTLAEM